MHGAESFLTILGLIVAGFIFFVIYFIFKILQFVLTATNLYKKMVRRQDATMKLLFDIRDNTKKYDKKTSLDDEDENTYEQSNICSLCGIEIIGKDKICPNCKLNIDKSESDKCVCGECETEVSDTDKFCSSCGTELSESGEYICSDCGTAISSEDNICPKCKKELDE